MAEEACQRRLKTANMHKSLTIVLSLSASNSNNKTNNKTKTNNHSKFNNISSKRFNTKQAIAFK
jgi:hypothetical protein